MIRFIPEVITAESPGERKVFDWFKKDLACSDFIVFHSFFVSKHLKRFSGEFDFIVIAPNKGIFLLEVKHGEIWRTDNEWFVRKGDGTISQLKKSPFEQLHDTMFSFQDWIKKALLDIRVQNRLGTKCSLLENLEFGYGVMFTSAENFNHIDPGWESWQIFLKADFQRPISHYIQRLEKGFDTKSRHIRVKPDEIACQALLALIRGDFHIQYELLSRINDLEVEIDELNKEQFDLLEIARYNKRCLFQGAAGTGKTLLAVQLFIEAQLEGKKAGLFCYNGKLAENLKRTIELKVPDSFVGTFDSFLLGKTGATIPDGDLESFFKEDLKYLFLEKIEGIDDTNRFDIIILDEAQDILSELNIEVIDAMLVGGVKNGFWSFFGDFNHQAIYDINAKEGLRILSERTGSVQAPPLKYNSRNTKKIGNNASILTKTEQPLFRLGTPEGDDVEFYFPATFSLKIKKLEEVLENFIEKRGLPPNKIMILSPSPNELTRYHSDKINEFLAKGVISGSIYAHKGLESSVVILIGFTSLLDDLNQKLLYVGLTRARTNLVVILDDRLQRERDQLLNDFMIKKISK